MLTANGLAMSNQAWLAYTIAFITADERLVLQVPSLQERGNYDGGRGYEITDLEESIGQMDVTTLKPFRQSACTDSVAVQILKLNRGMVTEGSSSSNSRPLITVLAILLERKATLPSLPPIKERARK